MKIIHYLLLILITVSFSNFKASKQQNPFGQVTYKASGFGIENEVLYYNAFLTFDSISSMQISHRNVMNKEQGLSVKTNGYAGVIAQNAYDEKGTIFYRNRATKEFLIRGKEIKPFPASIIVEDWVDIDWKIKKDFKVLFGFKIQKAIGTFRGRTWTAWFASDIPYPFGPGKLHGLPGVILEAKDKDYSFIATSVCFPCDTSETEKIERPNENKKYTSREFVRMTDNMAVYSMLEFQKQGRTWNPGRPMKCLYPATEESIKYRRLRGTDIIYEWETKNTKRAIYNKDTLDATVDYEAAEQLKKQNSLPPQTISLPALRQ